MKRINITSFMTYILGLITLAAGTAFMEKANFGMSMVVAPSYLVYLKLSAIFPMFTFGMAEYLTQAVLLVAMMVVLRSIRVKYLFAFVTTVLYGFLLDTAMALVGLIPSEDMVCRGVLFAAGMLVCASGVALLFRTNLPPEVYELFVKEISAKYGFRVSRCKTIYDITSCLIAVVLSFAFFGFGHFEGVKAGTIICALVNGTLIGVCIKAMDKIENLMCACKKAI